MARLQRSERLATLGQVAGGVAHELRNPLNVVKTSVYYLLNARNPTPEKQAEHLQRIERNVDAGRQRDHGAVELRQGAGARPAADRDRAAGARGARDQPAGRRRSRSRSIARRTAACPGRRRSAPDRARQPDPQRPRRDAAGRPAGDLGPRRSTASSRCRWPTPGSGSRPKDLARIMEPLYSTKARGLGLGLAIARSIVEKNQGSLRVTSEPGRGSTFTIRLTAVDRRWSIRHDDAGTHRGSSSSTTTRTSAAT